MMNHLDSRKANRDNNFNFLRLVLALLVILSHSPQLIDGDESREPLTMLVGFTSLGKLAVECFFLLSGYLIVQSWVQSPHIWSFLKKRILRIYPGFIVASFLCAFVVGPLGAQPEQYFKAFWYGGFVKSVVFLNIPEVPAVFEGQPYPSVNGSMWSISLEFTCYLFVLVLGSLGIFRRKMLWLFLAIGLYAVVLYSTLGLSSPYFSLEDPLFRLGTFFLTGGCFFLYRDSVNYKYSWALVCALIIFLCVLVAKIHYLIFAAAGAYLLFYLAFTPISFLKRFKKVPDVSYGVYLYGWPIQKLILWYFPATTPTVLFIVSALMSLLLGAASWYAVEKPFIKLKSFQLGRQIFSSGVQTKL